MTRPARLGGDRQAAPASSDAFTSSESGRVRATDGLATGRRLRLRFHEPAGVPLPRWTPAN